MQRCDVPGVRERANQSMPTLTCDGQLEVLQHVPNGMLDDVLAVRTPACAGVSEGMRVCGLQSTDVDGLSPLIEDRGPVLEADALELAGRFPDQGAPEVERDGSQLHRRAMRRKICRWGLA